MRERAGLEAMNHHYHHLLPHPVNFKAMVVVLWRRKSSGEEEEWRREVWELLADYVGVLWTPPPEIKRKNHVNE